MMDPSREQMDRLDKARGAGRTSLSDQNKLQTIAKVAKKLMEMGQSNRMAMLGGLSFGHAVKGDFEGSVTASWVKLREDGAGMCSYNGKVYATRPLGYVAIRAGQKVEMSFADGIYYSRF